MTSAGNVIKSPKTPKPPVIEEVEEVRTIEDDLNEETARQRRRSLLSGGRVSTLLSGITSQLKKRLGE